MSLRLYLLVGESRAGPFYRKRKKQRQTEAFISREILSNVTTAMTDSYLSVAYPWCFVISSSMVEDKYHYVGACRILCNEKGERTLVGMYSPVSHRWLNNNMQAEFPLTFWMSRILNMMQERDFYARNTPLLRQWRMALQRAYSPLWESFALTPAWRFKNRSQALLREGSEEDYCIRNSDGVDVMPWKNWPDSITQKSGIWLWRESRHRKILDSQRIR
ncbi:T6SS protein Cts1T [Enterobacter cloacae]|uniref:T6SS protein Cts1T n=1 Tax=Enterobacter cloacae TaxID=550 RepID=UPI00090806EE|nr:T6SS protein Cts1T [Enterobacter cloacae]